MIIVHKPELYVHGSAYYGMQANLENDKIFILKREKKVLIDEQVKSMHDKDACMWSYFGTPTIPPRTARLRGMGCRTFMLELFCGMMTSTCMAAQSGWPFVLQPTDAMIDRLDLTRKNNKG